MSQSQKMRKKHLTLFSNIKSIYRSVDFEQDIDDTDIRIYLHIGDRNLDPVSYRDPTSKFYLMSYFKKYGFNADEIWTELIKFLNTWNREDFKTI